MTIQYLAGIIDGEGHICRLMHKNGRGIAYPQSRIIVTNTCKPLMEAIKRRFGGYFYMRAARPKHLDCYVWVLAGKKAEALGRKLRPHLIVKAQQITRIV